jgi:hypothetical protein
VANNAQIVVNFLKKNLFSCFGVPSVQISDGGTHFYNQNLDGLMAKYDVKHKVYKWTSIQEKSPIDILSKFLKKK